MTGTKLLEFPVPRDLPGERANLIDSLATRSKKLSPRVIALRFAETSNINPAVFEPSDGGTFAEVDPLASELKASKAEMGELLGRMLFEQEELDWEVYKAYGLIDEDLTYRGSWPEDDRKLQLGERAFEIRLAEKMSSGNGDTGWFVRHGSSPLKAFPAHWPDDYRDLVERRLELTSSNRSIRLLESPEYKRRWIPHSWDRETKQAIESTVLDLLEAPNLWFDQQGPVMRSVAQIADLLRNNRTLLDLARSLTGASEPDLIAVLAAVASPEAVPYLAAYRFRTSGMEKHREWQSIWGLQHQADKGSSIKIPLPPNYGKGDFRREEYWRARGKLDVPKERFVLYPGVRREGDTSPVLGWGGWNHRDQAVALVREIMNQQALGASNDALVPMVAGLVELEPWLHQWHTDLEPDFGTSAAQAVTAQIEQFLTQLQMTREDLNAWRPPAAVRSRKRA